MQAGTSAAELSCVGYCLCWLMISKLAQANMHTAAALDAGKSYMMVHEYISILLGLTTLTE